MALVRIRRALLSVSDKAGLVELARSLDRMGIELLSTGGTHRALQEADIPVTEIAEWTGFPEMLGGRVKTLHPKVHAGILHRRDSSEHLDTIAQHDLPPIDMVVVNLYPFEATVAREGVTEEEAIENIDIGGPSMIRSAAKNHSHVAVVTDPSQYERVAKELTEHSGSLSSELLRELAVAAFARTADYDRAIHAYLSQQDHDPFPTVLTLTYRKQSALRYGENPHQQAAYYVDSNYRPAHVGRAHQRHGKELSYNNLLDLDSALGIVREFDQPAVSIIKHNNPCGAAVAETLVDAFRQAYAGDPLSAFGSVIGINVEVDAETAAALAEPNRFVEAIIAPSFSDAAFEILTTKPTWKTSVRLLEVGPLDQHDKIRETTMLNRPIEGGLLRQSPDLVADGWDDRKTVSSRPPTPAEEADLAFAWKMVKHIRSNAIVLVKDRAVIGVGAGQMSRVDAVEIATSKAGERAQGAVLASDAFFPFRDGVDRAASAGVAAVIQPGGSKRDADAIEASNEHQMVMVFTGTRHFKH